MGREAPSSCMIGPTVSLLRCTIQVEPPQAKAADFTKSDACTEGSQVSGSRKGRLCDGDVHFMKRAFQR